jgi:DNA-binding SARP family transcriptional activator/tetratricopeptide (TPR) repeat protein
VNFRILGPIEVHGDDGGSLQLGKRMERALLASLVLHAREVRSTDQLIDGLWAEHPPARADASLHSLVARLRRSLQPDRQAGESSSRLVRQSPGYLLVASDDEIDARRFERRADDGRRLLAQGDAVGAHRHLAAALAEWRGPALAEFAYEPFADREAARLEELRLGVTEADLGARLALGEPNLVPELEQCVVAYRLRENFWAYLLIALYRGGRQADALRRAADLRRTLGDVGLDPSPRLRRIEAAILEHDPALASAAFVLDLDGRAATPVTTGPNRSGARTDAPIPRWLRRGDRFVGRVPELADLESARRRSADGEVLAVAVIGEPGIGKSSLAFEAAQAALDDGAVVLAGRCSPGSAMPFEPFVEALGRVLDVLSDDDLVALGEHATRLARLLPAHSVRLGERPIDVDERGDVDRYLLFESVIDLLVVYADRSPIVIVIDDLQWADEATLRLLDHLIRADRLDRTLVVTTIRAADLDLRDSLRAVLDDWLRLRSATRIELGGLSTSELEDLVSDPGDDEPSRRSAHAAFAKTLHAATGGNPFFAVEIVRGLGADGATDVEPLELPESVQALVRTRLRHISADRRQVLETAALIGQRIDTDLLVGVIGDEGLVLAALDDATAAGLLVERPGTLSFRHDLVRTTLAASCGPALRTARHRAIGRTLVERHRADLAPVADLLAHHFVRAAADGDATDAARYSLLAGDASVAALAYETAVTRYEAGLRAVAGARPVPSAFEIDLRLSLAEAWRRLGDLDRTARVTTDAIELIVEHGDVNQFRRAAWSFAYGVPGGEAGTAPSSDLLEIEQKLKLLEDRLRDDPRSTDEDLAIVGLAQASVSNDLGRSAASIEIMSDALDRYSSTWSSETVVCSVDLALTVLGEHRPIEERAQIVERLLALLDERDDFSAEQRLQTYSAVRWIWLATGRVDDALALDELLEQHAERLGMPRYLAGIAQRRATLEIVRGRFAEAETYANEALNHRPDVEFFEGYVAQLALIRFYQGRLAEMLESMEAMDDNVHPAWTVGRSLMWAAAGDEPTARKLLVQFLDDIDSAERDITWLGTLALASFTADHLGDAELVPPLIAALEPHAGRLAMAGRGAVIFAPVDLLLGMLHAVRGDLGATESHLRSADPQIAALGASALTARRELVHAEVLSRSGPLHQEESLARARSAVAVMEHLRMGGQIVERGTALLSAQD